MAKLTGPCFAIEAHGSLGKTLTFGKVRKTNYAKKHTAPANPKSDAQVGVRAGTKFITQTWSGLSSAARAQWETLGESLSLSPYHAYLRINSQRWAQHRLPITDRDSTTDPSYGGLVLHMDVTGRVHTIYLAVFMPNSNPISAEFCLSTDSGFTPTRSFTKVIAGDPSPPGADWVFTATWTAPDDNLYYCKSRYAINSGNSTSFIPETY